MSDIFPVRSHARPRLKFKEIAVRINDLTVVLEISSELHRKLERLCKAGQSKKSIFRRAFAKKTVSVQALADFLEKEQARLVGALAKGK